MPPVGNHRRVPPKTMSRISASQNVGTDQNTSDVDDAILSKRELRFQPARVPSHRPSTIARIAALPVSSMVGQK